MKSAAGKLFICLSFGLILSFCFTVTAPAQLPPTNRLETGGNYQIAPPPTNMMFQITDNPTNAGDDNLIWSNSGRMLAVDRSDPNAMGMGGNKYICLLNVRNLGNVQVLGARSSAATNPLFANITGWTWNDDRVLFGWQPQIGNPPSSGKVRLMSCTTTGDVNVVPFLTADPQANPTNHIYSPSVVLDPAINQERLLCLVSSSTNNNEAGPTDVSTQPAARINLFTVPFDSGSVPNWTNRVQLTAFNTNLSISSAKWCPELGTNYQPIGNRIVILLTSPQAGGPTVDPPAPVENNKIVVFNNVQGVIANPDTAPTSLADPHFVVIETNLTMNSQVSWTFDGQYVMYGRTGTNPPPAPVSSDLYSKRTDSPTNMAVKFEVPSSISGGQKQWLSISPDGMKAAFTVDHKIYTIPLQFDNVAVTGAVVTNTLTDASYTAVDVPGDAIPSNTTFNIVAPPSVDTNYFNGEFSGFAREFSASGVSSQFNLATNATMTLHFSETDIPSGVSATNLAIYVYNPQATNAGGPTGTWTQLTSIIDTNDLTIAAEVQHFSIYAIGRASAQPEGLPPAAPGNVSATKGTYSDKVRVAWDSVSNATSYEVWRNTSNASNSATKFDTEPTSTNYDDTNTVAGTIYYYWVKAKNAYGSSDFSSSDSGYAAGTPTPPAAPASVSATKGTDPDMVSITWTAVSNATSYEVWRNTSDASNSAAKFDTEPTSTNLDDENAVVGTVYYYWVKAKNAAGTSGFSASDSGWLAEVLTEVCADYDGDGKADPAVYVESTGVWYIKLSASGYGLVTLTFGGVGYKAVHGDFDGDGKADPATYQTATGNWSVQLSGSGYAVATLAGFGGSSCEPVAGDYDGDGKADPATYNTTSGDWLVAMSSMGYGTASAAGFGGAAFAAVQENYDSDNRFDAAIYNTTNGNWTILLSAQNYITATLWGFGGDGYDPVLGDFDGDGLADLAIYQESTGNWAVKLSGSQYATATLTGFGGDGYGVLAADFDGDRKADPTLFEMANGLWHIKLSASGYIEATLASGYTP